MSSLPPPSLPPPPPAAGWAGAPVYGVGWPPGPAPAYAGFGARLGASILDWLFGLLFALPAVVMFIASIVAGEDGPCSTTNSELDRCWQPHIGLLLAAIVVVFVGGVGFYWYMCSRLGRTGQTPGRRVTGIKVVDQRTGAPIGGGRALGRMLFAGFVSGQVCYLGYLWMLWDDRKRTWHDMIVDSIVVRA